MVYTNLYNFLNQKGGESDINFDAKKAMSQLQDKKGLLLAVMGYFILQLSFSYYIMNKNEYYNNLIKKKHINNIEKKDLKNVDTKKLDENNTKFIVFSFILFGLILLLCFFNISSYIKFFVFLLFFYILGIILILCKYLFGYNFSETLIKGMIAVIFSFFILFALLFFIKIKNIQTILFILYTLLVIVFALISNMFTEETTLVYRFVTFLILIITTLYITYDTHNILQRNYHNDFVTASLDYFLDMLKLLNIWFQKLVFYKEYQK